MSTPLLRQLLVATAIAYLAAVAATMDDKALLFFQGAWNVGFELPVASGQIKLPGVNVSLSIAEYFLLAPLAVVSLHIFSIAALPRGRGTVGEAAAQLQTALALLVAPAALLVFERTYVPFAAARPGGGMIDSAYALTIYHAALILIDALIVLGALIFGLIRLPVDDHGRLGIPLLAVLAIAFAVVLARCAFDMPWIAHRMTERDGGVLLPAGPAVIAGALLVGSIAPFLASDGARFRGAAALMRSVRPVLRLTARYVSIQGLPTLEKGRIPMIVRLTFASFALLALVQIAGSRTLDLAGQTLARGVPSETIIAAYITDAENKRAAWAEAINDNAHGLNLAGWRLARANFQESWMPKVTLVGADLTGADLSSARLTGADLSGATLTGAILRDAEVLVLAQSDSGGSLAKTQSESNANAAGAKFYGTTLNGADFSHADLTGAEFTSAGPSDITSPGDCEAFVGNLKTNLPKGIAELADRLAGTILNSTVLDKAHMAGLDFARVKSMEMTSFVGADLRCTSFAGLSLAGVVFSKARKEEERVDCEEEEKTPHAQMTGADLSRATLTGAHLVGIDFTGVRNLDTATIKGADLRCAKFVCLDLHGLDFTGATLQGADFRGALVTDGTFNEAKLDNAKFGPPIVCPSPTSEGAGNVQ